MTNQQAHALTQKFAAVNNEVIALVEQCADANWGKPCSEEHWSVGVTARHLASGYQSIGGLVAAVATGQPLPPITMDMINQGNAQHAKEHANCTKAEVLDLLRKDSAAAVSIIDGLSDEQLAHTGQLMGRSVSAQWVAETILIEHTAHHLASLKAALSA